MSFSASFCYSSSASFLPFLIRLLLLVLAALLYFCDGSEPSTLCALVDAIRPGRDAVFVRWWDGAAPVITSNVKECLGVSLVTADVHAQEVLALPFTALIAVSARFVRLFAQRSQQRRANITRVAPALRRYHHRVLRRSSKACAASGDASLMVSC